MEILENLKNFYFYCQFSYYTYSGFLKVVARKGLKDDKFPKVVAFAQPNLVAQPKVVAFSAQLLLETHYIMSVINGTVSYKDIHINHKVSVFEDFYGIFDDYSIIKDTVSYRVVRIDRKPNL